MASGLKAELRRSVWRMMDEYHVAIGPRPCYGKIPSFIGSAVAARRILKRDFFRNAQTIYTTLDAPSAHLRVEALRMGKTVVMATPYFRRGLLLIDGAQIPKGRAVYAATLRGALELGQRVDVTADLKIDLFLTGSVAVDEKGGRLGRGDGMQDLEYAILRELRMVTEKTVTATLVHDIQVVDSVPMEYHDVPMDYISTPTRLIAAKGGYPKPGGVFWDAVNAETMDRIPILRVLAGLR